MSREELKSRFGVEIPEDELRERSSLSGGPGGQHANKTSSRVTIWWSPGSSRALNDQQRERLLQKLGSRLTRDGELQLHVETHRSQRANREEARERLASVVCEALVRPKKRRPTRPTKGSVKRRLDGKRRRGDVKRNRGRVRDD